MAAALLVSAVLGGVVIAGAPNWALVACGGALLVLLTALFPVPATAVYVAVNPLLAGAERGMFVPQVRLNEALLVPLAAGLLVAGLRRWATATGVRPRFHRLDAVVVAVAATGSVTPLLWMYARDRAISTDDLLYGLTLWRLAVLYAVVRIFVRGPRATRTVLVAVLVGAVAVGAVGLLQVLGAGPVVDALTRLTPPGADGYAVDGSRATSTLGNPIAYGDVMVYAALVAAALALRGVRPRGLLAATAALLTLCALASGQVSVLLGVATTGVVFAVTTGAVGPALLAAAGAVLVGLTVLRPVLAARLGDTDPQTGLPVSWTGRYGRLENLEVYFWPQIGADWNWLLGVRPAARVPGAESWRDWVYIESGYTWLVWTGGLPMLVAALGLVLTAAHTGNRLRRAAEPVTAAVGTVVFTIAVGLVVLLVFDPHLTLRGGAELLFVLLALGAGLDPPDARRDGADSPALPAPEPRVAP